MSAPYHPALLATPVPRYTSYPTAAEFHEGVGPADMAAALAAVPAETPLSLYLHIPYCEQICWYCGCNTGAANKPARLAAYLAALGAEMALVAERLGGRGRVGRIAFGGGSPNAIAPEDFLHLVRRLKALFAAEEAELSVEIDPRGFGDAWAAALAEAGVSHASLGVQTLAPDIQAAIGRVQPAALIEAAAAALHSAGVRSLNFDLMYGLPGQSLGDLGETLAAAVEMGPERIALFGYAHVPHLIPRQRRIDASALPSPAERFAQAAFGHRFLTDAGYEAVGFDHFALPGDPLARAAAEGMLRRNFQGFTDDPAETLIGLGASAISQFPHLLVQNEKNAGRYRMLLSAGRLPAARGIARPAEERRRARAIEALLCRGEAELAGLSVDEARLAPFEEAGMAVREAGRLRLAPGTLPYARSIAATLDVHRAAAPGRFSHAV